MVYEILENLISILRKYEKKQKTLHQINEFSSLVNDLNEIKHIIYYDKLIKRFARLVMLERLDGLNKIDKFLDIKIPDEMLSDEIERDKTNVISLTKEMLSYFEKNGVRSVNNSIRNLYPSI